MKLTQMLDEAVDRGRLRAGAAAVLTAAEETIAVAGTEPVGAETLFGIGSITKLLTAITTLRVADRHGFDLDRPVMTVLDSLPFAQHEHWPQVTVRHLLSHTSGLPAGGRDWGPGGRDALARFAREDLVGKPSVGRQSRRLSIRLPCWRPFEIWSTWPDRCTRVPGAAAPARHRGSQPTVRRGGFSTCPGFWRLRLGLLCRPVAI